MIRRWYWLILVIGSCFCVQVQAQPGVRTLSPHYTGYDVRTYNLELKLDADTRRIAGTCRIRLEPVQYLDHLALDLASTLRVVSVRMAFASLGFQHQGDSLVLKFPVRLQPGKQYEIEIIYGGVPGHSGIWQQDLIGHELISLYQAGLSPSAWWPVKDHPSDLADSIRLSIIYPQEMQVVSNGILTGTRQEAGLFLRWDYRFPFMISPSEVELQIGDYVELTETYRTAAAEREIHYYVLAYREAVAREHLQEVKPILTTLERVLGGQQFPAYAFTWIENPVDLDASPEAQAQSPATGPDPLLIRQLAGLWFGKTFRLTTAPGDHQMMDMLRVYAELLYIEQTQSLDAAVVYLREHRTPDYQGAALLHRIRENMQDDPRWFAMLRDMTSYFKGQQATWLDVVLYISAKTETDYLIWFRQYLLGSYTPVLEYDIVRMKRKLVFSYRWVSDEPAFNLPVNMVVAGEETEITPTTTWQSRTFKGVNEKDLALAPYFGLFEQRKVSRP
ncbi:MAG: hypothetical protein SF053_02095 [Bacteroidia bacterium]|jgi:aminopeptidase N|nr:hypothetical protein [Bacteroidia bacterium]